MEQRDREMLDRRFSSHETRKLPPQNIEAEQSVLGGMIIDNNVIPFIAGMLLPDDFYRTSHQEIFSAAINLYAKDKIVDLVILTNELKAKNKLDAVGGAYYIASLIDAVPTAENIKYHAGIVKDKAVLRKIILSATELIEVAHEENESPDAVLAMFQKFSGELIEKCGAVGRGKTEKMKTLGILDCISNLRETPYSRINDAITGFLSKELIAVAGRPNFGKTSFVSGILLHIALNERKPAIYFGTAFSKERFKLRLLSSVSQIPFNDLIKGKISGEQVAIALEAEKKLDVSPIYYLIEPEKLNVISVIAEAQKIKNELGELGVIIIENLQELYLPSGSASSKKNWISRKEELDIIAAALTGLTDKVETPIIVSCQINKDADEREDGIPTIGDIKDTGAVGEKAIKVFLLHRPVYYQNLAKGVQEQIFPERAKVIIAKGGPAITVELYFDGPTYSWRDID